MRPRHAAALIAALTLSIAHGTTQSSSGPIPRTPVMSFHNRLLLNRLVVNGHRDVEVMIALKAGRFDEGLALVARLGGRVRRSEPEIAYVRVLVGIDRFVELVTDACVEAYQIASLSSVWYKDGRPRAQADTVRRNEVRPVVSESRVERRQDLPALSAEEARSSGYTADQDSGVGRWLIEHPTFDGRGITIAFLETGLLEYGHPALQTAKTLDGADVPKIAGILNTLTLDDDDETRVHLDVELQATHSWQKVGHRTYALPGPGHYRFGLFSLSVGKGLVQPFAILRNEGTHEIRVDTDSDADFRNERPIVDANVRMDVAYLHISHPRAADLAFVLTAGREPNYVHIYVADSAHHTMTVSVATGNATETGLAVGVAPGARALVVRYFARNVAVHTALEGYLDVIRRPDVDILCDSTVLGTVPDTAGEFVAIFFRRLLARYRKPIVHSAGNAPRFMNSVSAIGEVFTVGGSMGPTTFASIYGGAQLSSLIVHPMSAAGPALDGAVKPDFLAPENLISAGVWIEDGFVPLPKNAPTHHLPAGYEISCCTSASSPYAAGVAALLLSAAKQQGVPYSVETLGHALRESAQFLSTWPAHQQGNGVLEVDAAWRELQRAIEFPKISVKAANAHALTPYAGRGSEGVGLFEHYGWKPGERRRRTLDLIRESGQDAPLTYQVSWVGNDGTFAAPQTVTLPLNVSTPLQVTISAHLPGAHSAILNLHDAETNAVVFRTQATIVVATPPSDKVTGGTRLSGSIPLMRSDEHFVDMPEGVGALSIELKVEAGSLSAAVLPPNGLYRSYDGHVVPLSGRTFTKGNYRLLWPRPEAGVWTFHLANVSASQESDASLVSTDTATYTMVVQPIRISLNLRQLTSGSLEVDVRNHLGALREPVLEVSLGTQRTYDAALLPTGLPNLFEIDVPEGASTLRLDVRSATRENQTLELYLYDCTSGECFSWDFTLPARPHQTLAVAKPTPGRWVAAVNAAPSPVRRGRFTLDEVVTTGARRVPAVSSGSRHTGATWTERLGIERWHDVVIGRTEVVLCELVDLGAEREASNAWDNREGVVGLEHRSMAMGTAILPVK